MSKASLRPFIFALSMLVLVLVLISAMLMDVRHVRRQMHRGDAVVAQVVAVPATEPEAWVTDFHYRSSQLGMPRSTVAGMMGSPGSLACSAREGRHVVETYEWYSKDGAGHVTAVFTDGILTEKSQTGLE